MRKATLIAIALLLPAVSLLASPVKKSAAKATATAFLQKQVSHSNGAKHAPRKLELVSAEADNAPYYVFNNQNGEGFAIVSGDDTVENPILGYSTEGNLSEENMPEALRAILADYATVVEFAQKNGLSMKRAPRKADRADVTPFIEFAWNQSAPYNNQAPATAGESHASLGCMPVTVSMIVAHFGKLDENGDPVASGTTITLPAAYNGTYTNPATEYDCTAFRKTYSYVGDNIDGFMYHIANLLGTNYTQSSAQESILLPTFKNTLGWNKNMKSVMRDAYTATDWEEIIYNELAAKRPVNFLGSHSKLGGHSYLTDGFKDGMFHILWGWGNTCVGYFDMDVLNPFVEYLSSWGGMGYDCPPAGFTSGLKAIIGIQPTDTEGVAERLITVDDIMKDGANGIRADLFNYGNETYRGKLSWAFLHEDGTFEKIANAPETNISYETGRIQTAYLNIANLGLTDGSYKIVAISKTNDTGAEWTLCECYSQKYVEVEVVDGQLTIIPHPVKDVKVESIVFKGATGDYLELIMKLKNLGDDVFGFLNISVTRDDGDTWYVDGAKHPIGSTMDIAMKKGESKLLSVFIEHGGSYTSHTYDVNVQYMKKNLGTFTIDPSASFPSSYYIDYIAYKGVDFEDYQYVDGNAYLYSNTLKGNVNVENSYDYAKYYIPVKLTLKDENMEVVYENITVNYLNKEIKGYPIEVTGLQAGKTYYLTAQLVNLTRSVATYSETVVKSFFTDFPINVTVGIPYYTENGKIERQIIEDETTKVDLPANTAAVDFRKFGSDLVNLSSITNENCVYVFNAGDEVPAELDGKNVVVGNTAEELNLVDGKPVAFPVSFTAAEATYSRPMTDDNWNTIVVPFAATVKVEGEDADIDWFRRGEANGRKFWLYKFNGSDAASVYFDAESAKTMTANTPYLISVPGDQWGDKYQLDNKTLVFHGSNVAISSDKPEVATPFYTFKGTYTAANTNGGYKLNDNGDFFELQTEDVNENPFHAFFLGDEATTPSKQALTLSLGDVPTLIINVEDARQAIENTFDLQGRRVQNAQKGIYIRNGKKVVIK